jgi:hypothetical protein
MGCDYFADENGRFKAVVKPSDNAYGVGVTRTIDLKLESNQPVYDTDIEYDSDMEQIEIECGRER